MYGKRNYRNVLIFQEEVARALNDAYKFDPAFTSRA